MALIAGIVGLAIYVAISGVTGWAAIVFVTLVVSFEFRPTISNAEPYSEFEPRAAKVFSNFQPVFTAICVLVGFILGLNDPMDFGVVPERFYPIATAVFYAAIGRVVGRFLLGFWPVWTP